MAVTSGEGVAVRTLVAVASTTLAIKPRSSNDEDGVMMRKYPNVLEDAFTVGDLREELASYGDDVRLSFSGRLTFGRLKRLGTNEVFLEFEEAQAYLSERVKKRNPNLKVAFISTSHVEWDESGLLGGPIDVELR